MVILPDELREGAAGSEATPESEGELVVLDLHHLSALAASLAPRGPGFLRGFVERFLVDAERGIAELTAGLERNDLGAMRAVAHRLRSGAATLGGMRLAHRLGSLEAAARRGAPREAAQIERLVRELRELTIALRAAGVLGAASEAKGRS